MSHDPFHDLEQQLRTAIDTRKPRARRVSRRALVAVAATLSIGTGVAAAAGVFNRDADRAAVNRAVAAGESARTHLVACDPSPSQRGTRLVAGPVPPAISRQLGVFRRAATARDHVSPKLLAGSISTVLRDSVRVAQTTDGRRFLLFIGRGPGLFTQQRDPIACVRGIRSAALRAAATSSAGVQRRVMRIERGRVARTESLLAGTTVSVWMLGLDGHGAGIARQGIGRRCRFREE